MQQATFGKYIVTSDGKIFLSGKELKPFDNVGRGGFIYKRIKLVINGKRKAVYVHRLVAQVFLGDIESKHVDHLDCDTSNNSIDNLMILEPEENYAKRVFLKYSKNSKRVFYK